MKNNSISKWIIIAITVLGIFAGFCITWGSKSEKLVSIEKAVDNQKIDYETKYKENKLQIQKNEIKIQEVDIKAQTALVRIDTKLESMSDDIEEIKAEVKKQ